MFIVHASRALLLQGATLPDTIVTKQIAERGWLETLVSVEQAIVGLLMLALLAAVVLLLLGLRKGIQELTNLVRTSTNDVANAAHAVRTVADDVKHIATRVRGEIDGVTDTVHSVQERVREVVDAADLRVRRFGALVDVAQEEAEEMVVSAAATMRGVRAGADTLRRTLTFSRFAGGQSVRHPRRRGLPEREETEGITDGGVSRGPYTRTHARGRV